MPFFVASDTFGQLRLNLRGDLPVGLFVVTIFDGTTGLRSSFHAVLYHPVPLGRGGGKPIPSF